MPITTSIKTLLAPAAMAFALVFTAAGAVNIASVPVAEAKRLCKPAKFYRKLYRKQCERDVCGIFAGMAKDNAGSEAGHQQALVAGACLVKCAVKSKTMSHTKLILKYGSKYCTN